MNVSSKQTYLFSLARSSEKSAAGSLYVNSKALGQIFSPIPLSYMMDASSKIVQALPYLINAVIKTCFDISIWIFSCKVASYALNHHHHHQNEIMM